MHDQSALSNITFQAQNTYSGSQVTTDGNGLGRLGEHTSGIHIANVDLDRAKVIGSQNAVGPGAI
jgi:hypothetical protein